MRLIHAEYVKEKSSLTYPSMCFLKYAFIEADSILNESISSLCFRRNVSALLHSRLYDKLNLSFLKCIEHKEESKCAIIQIITKSFLYTFCKIINTILSGRDSRHIGRNFIFRQALEYYKKKQKTWKRM